MDCKEIQTNAVNSFSFNFEELDYYQHCCILDVDVTYFLRRNRDVSYPNCNIVGKCR